MPKKPKKKKRSAAWKKFKHEFFGRSNYINGVNPSFLLALEGEERDEAEDMLIDIIKRPGLYETHVATAIKPEKILPVLKEKIKNASGVEKIHCAVAIEKIEGSGEFIPIIIEELLGGAHESIREEAARGLDNFPTQEVINALFKGILDPAYTVRYHSLNSLYRVLGFYPDTASYQKIFRLICSDLESTGGENPVELYEKAAEMLKELIKKKKIVS